MTISMAPRRFIHGGKESGRTICVWLLFVFVLHLFDWNDYAGVAVDGNCFWRRHGVFKAEIVFFENTAKPKHREDRGLVLAETPCH